MPDVLARLRTWPAWRKAAIVILLILSLVLCSMHPRLRELSHAIGFLGMTVAGILLKRSRLPWVSLISMGAVALARYYLSPERPNWLSWTLLAVVFLIGYLVSVGANVAMDKLDLLQVIARTTTDMTYVVDERGTVRHINDKAAQALGYRREEMVGRSMKEFLPPWFLQEAQAVLSDTVSGGICKTRRIHVLTRAQRELVFAVAVRPIRYQGDPCLLGIGRDTTREEFSERLMTAAFDSIGSPAVVLSPDRQIIACNDAFAQAVGQPKGSLVGTLLDDIDGRTAFPLDWLACWAPGEPLHSETQSVSGRFHTIDAFPVLDGRHRLIAALAIITDVTEHKQAEAQFVQAAQLAAVGEMATGIAHNINNLLTAISISAELLLVDPLRLGPKVTADILAAVDRGAQLVHRLYRVAGGGGGATLQTIPALEVVSGVLQLVEPQLARQGIRVENLIPEDLKVTVDGNALHQVITNLVINGIHAMSPGGTLTLSAVSEADHVDLMVSDTGGGISPENLGRVFLPFFTTKPKPQGTGLGLSSSLAIMRDHGGDLFVASEVGRGSTFTVRIPRPGAAAPEGGSMPDGAHT